MPGKKIDTNSISVFAFNIPLPFQSLAAGSSISIQNTNNYGLFVIQVLEKGDSWLTIYDIYIYLPVQN